MDELPQKSKILIKRLAEKLKTTKTRILAEYFSIFHDLVVQGHPEFLNDDARHNHARAVLKSVYEPILL
ncbi:hypothetical protein [Candidatus Borrarchaeum sp.]|uniref:hypothetical protein n=1 Tax=Candidatus Borrarchaeum sp. TaxID=2846742 RepID=UPI00257BAD62|nr:hypothetical protein [Candidatus Borrarchaeum sp.]